MKIPFDIKYRPQIESGEYKVVTRKDLPVRIICWDCKDYDGYHIIGLVESESGEEFHAYYYDNGTESKCRESELDLFVLIQEAELTLFEQHLLVCLQKVYYAHCESQDVNNFLIGTIRQYSKSLLEFAKKEICKGCTVGLDQYCKGREDARKEAERSYTFHYPIYEPLCFHGGVCTNPMRDCINCPMHSSGTTTNTTSGTCKKED